MFLTKTKTVPNSEVADLTKTEVTEVKMQVDKHKCIKNHKITSNVQSICRLILLFTCMFSISKCNA